MVLLLADVIVFILIIIQSENDIGCVINFMVSVIDSRGENGCLVQPVYYSI